MVRHGGIQADMVQKLKGAAEKQRGLLIVGTLGSRTKWPQFHLQCTDTIFKLEEELGQRAIISKFQPSKPKCGLWSVIQFSSCKEVWRSPFCSMDNVVRRKWVVLMQDDTSPLVMQALALLRISWVILALKQWLLSAPSALTWNKMSETDNPWAIYTLDLRAQMGNRDILVKASKYWF